MCRMRAYTAVIRVYNAAGNRDSRWIGSIRRIEGIYKHHVALPSLWGQSYIPKSSSFELSLLTSRTVFAQDAGSSVAQYLSYGLPVTASPSVHQMESCFRSSS